MKNLSLVFRSLALPVLLLTLNAAGAQEKQPLRYVDAATLTVIGKSMPTPKLFQRVDTARYELWQPVKNYSAFSTGLAVVFRTDSRTIRARWKTGGYIESPVRVGSINAYISGYKGLKYPMTSLIK